MGERRWRATQEAGLDTIPAIIRDTDDTDMLRDALLENLHRSAAQPAGGGLGLRPAARGLRLHPRGAGAAGSAARARRSATRIRLLKLSPAVQRRVAAGVLSAGHARSLLAVEDPELQDRLAQRVVAEGISVRGLEEIVAVGDAGTAPVAARTPRQAHRARPRRAAPTGSRTASRPGSRSTSAEPRARSPSSSPAWTTCGGSSTSWTRATAPTARSDASLTCATCRLCRQSDLSTRVDFVAAPALGGAAGGALALLLGVQRARPPPGSARCRRSRAGSHQEPGGCSSAG